MPRLGASNRVLAKDSMPGTIVTDVCFDVRTRRTTHVTPAWTDNLTEMKPPD